MSFQSINEIFDYAISKEKEAKHKLALETMYDDFLADNEN